jgi:bifunctional UDP-N-acetylglucosamine pyrophosphorylase/glucosamine-1-phosphate N-acetyltransferase
VGAGSVITKDVPEGALAVTRARQTTVAGWERPRKNKPR